MFENISVEKNNAVATITLHRPTNLNALNTVTIEELHHAYKQREAETEVRAIIVRDSREKAFVAGADISEFANFNVSEGSELARKGQELLFDFVENLQTPVIAAINGFALGGGLELAMASHIRIASNNA